MNLNAARKCNKFAVIFISLSFLCYFLKQSQLRNNPIRKYWILSSTELYPNIKRGDYQWWNVKEKQLSKKRKKAEKVEPELEFLLHEQSFGICPAAVG